MRQLSHTQAEPMLSNEALVSLLTSGIAMMDPRDARVLIGSALIVVGLAAMFSGVAKQAG